MAEIVYSVIGSLESVPAEYQSAVVTVCAILIALLLAVFIDAVLRFFGWLFGHLG